MTTSDWTHQANQKTSLQAMRITSGELVWRLSETPLRRRPEKARVIVEKASLRLSRQKMSAQDRRSAWETGEIMGRCTRCQQLAVADRSTLSLRMCPGLHLCQPLRLHRVREPRDDFLTFSSCRGRCCRRMPRSRHLLAREYASSTFLNRAYPLKTKLR